MNHMLGSLEGATIPHEQYDKGPSNNNSSSKMKNGSQVDKIIKLDHELRMLNDENMNPKDIYLEHCL